MKPYFVIDTPCYPNRWKVADVWDHDNATCLFFKDKMDAEREADKKNKHWEATTHDQNALRK